MENQNILERRRQYKNFGLLELWIYDTVYLSPDLDYSKIPTKFSYTWFTPDQNWMIQTEDEDMVSIHDYKNQFDFHSWRGKFEDSFTELKRLGYGK